MIDAEAWQAKRSLLLDVRKPKRRQDPTCACREAIRLPEAAGRAAKRSQEAAFGRPSRNTPERSGWRGAAVDGSGEPRAERADIYFETDTVIDPYIGNMLYYPREPELDS